MREGKLVGGGSRRQDHEFSTGPDEHDVLMWRAVSHVLGLLQIDSLSETTHLVCWTIPFIRH